MAFTNNFIKVKKEATSTRQVFTQTSPREEVFLAAEKGVQGKAEEAENVYVAFRAAAAAQVAVQALTTS